MPFNCAKSSPNLIAASTSLSFLITLRISAEFGRSSEFIAMKTCVEAIVGIRYKLRMFGVPVETAARVLSDNQGVVNNTTKLESVLSKKHSSIAYHAVRWAVAAGIVQVGKINMKENLADAMTKRLPEVTRNYLFGNWTY